MGLGALTVSVHVSLSQRGADSGGLIETDTEKSAISPSAPARGDRSTAWNEWRLQQLPSYSQRSSDLLYFIHPFINKSSVDGNLSF